ncbi:UDP-glucuronate:xylan alpha-glucuronosyltransferase 1 [Diospyros lotus]|uniref:UDP-glucuronate:xylan alpha-glucuronosyltransferase 1 n=1 Tax=Diospyros lotus TaxID=55363 RepID=UPI00224E9921|nr:UDP-glucuronate:xylan alpha-glucuronosyltransferase 1 [Diospyros lotus]XP_052204218.1 UDP-glucuronate:xylan alpha-glucuronosyltransferase 1 [Diospyros lotus]
MEARQRSFLETYKRKLQQRSKVKDVEKPFHIDIPSQDKTSKFCKFHHLKLVFLLILLAASATLLYSPSVCHRNCFSFSISRLVWGGSNARYISHLDIDWDDISKAISKISLNNRIQGIGLLNFNHSEVDRWKQLIPSDQSILLHLDHARKTLTWDALYPEWIDEEQEDEVPTCPSLPKIEPPNRWLDVIVVKLPCRDEGNWSRDVARLHLQLAAAQLAAATAAASSKGRRPPVHLLFVTNCFPIPNLFTCKELVLHQGNVWLYKPNLDTLRPKLQLPVGSCEIALPPKAKGRRDPHREAYATILHSAHVYVCGAIVAAQSIRMAGSTRDLVILVDETISQYHKSGLEAAGWKIRTIQRIRNPKAEKDAYNEWNYSKFRLWQLTDYDKIIFIDADLLILRNIDFLFSMPEISATGNNGTLFNSGVMVIEPSNCTFRLLMDHINEIESYNGGDQGYLNEIFTWWHRIPKHINFLKHFWVGDDEAVKRKKIKLFGAEPPVLYVLHYLGMKPWLCFRDYDCNWNSDIFREFASDVAHKKWWKVHDAMPEELQQFCLLRSKQKAQLEWDRMQAENENFEDGHWKKRIKDGRLHKCIDNLCSWESMLKHWGETNWTDDGFLNLSLSHPHLPAITRSSLSLSGL